MSLAARIPHRAETKNVSLRRKPAQREVSREIRKCEPLTIASQARAAEKNVSLTACAVWRKCEPRSPRSSEKLNFSARAAEKIVSLAARAAMKN